MTGRRIYAITGQCCVIWRHSYLMQVGRPSCWTLRQHCGHRRFCTQKSSWQHMWGKKIFPTTYVDTKNQVSSSKGLKKNKPCFSQYMYTSEYTWVDVFILIWTGDFVSIIVFGMPLCNQYYQYLFLEKYHYYKLVCYEELLSWPWQRHLRRLRPHSRLTYIKVML